ncbi:MAG TPA: 50S ribosomal protein L3 N(5)-glutamine methyltransferase [Opitutaceae bacterium]|nr:50S ribosomal protein L3 N(5)-glutamine methyltransferase [Opitutaceae bacterium]
MARPRAADPLAGAPGPAPLGRWLRFAEGAYARSGAAFGQVATSAHDEALYLLLHALGLPLDSGPEALERELTAAEAGRAEALLRRRLVDRIPAAYLTREAWLGEHRFHVDERVIIPRSYFLEIIPRLRGHPRRIADVCTGSGCLAILLAHRFPRAEVDAVDLSPDALAVAAINVREHGVAGRVRLRRGDVFAGVPPAAYDLIVSNPPYEPSALMAGLPEEFRKEPRMALDGGRDGLDVIRRLLAQARDRLAPGGRVLIEVGGLRPAMDREFAALRPRWLQTADGANCVCEIRGERLG